MRLGIIGLGFTGQRLAKAVQGDGTAVLGTVRSAEKAGLLAAQGMEVHVYDGAEPLSAAFKRCTHVLMTAPPPRDGDDPVAAHVASLVPPEAWVGVLSTTGVYGDAQGGWVDEESSLNATEPRSLARIRQETTWCKLLPQTMVFRLPGIYGPGRSVLEQLVAGTARRVHKPGHMFCRVHVDDIVRAVRAAMEQDVRGTVINVTDDEPAESAAVTAYGAALLQMAPPPLQSFDEAAMSPMARSFWSASRRVSNARMKDLLGPAPRYPSYREGLVACLAESDPRQPVTDDSRALAP